MNHSQKLETLRKELNDSFPERTREIDSILACVIVRQNVFLGGPPGTAKSRLAEAICKAFSGAYFKYQFHSQSTFSEVFGGRDLDAAKNGTVRFNTTGKLPESSIALLDEIFKAHSVLQSLLGSLEEHEFNSLPIPLNCAIGTSNELPTETDLEALFDRFIPRHWVSYCRDPQNIKAIMTGFKGGNVAQSIDPADLAAIRNDARAIKLDPATLDLIIEIKTQLEKQGFVSSDRRWRKIIDLLRAYVVIDGKQQIDEDTISDRLTDLLWRETTDRPQIDQIIKRLANPNAAAAQEIIDEAEELIRNTPAAEGKNDPKYLAAIAQNKTDLEKMAGKLLPLGKTRPVETARERLAELDQENNRNLARALGMAV